MVRRPRKLAILDCPDDREVFELDYRITGFCVGKIPAAAMDNLPAVALLLPEDESQTFQY